MRGKTKRIVLLATGALLLVIIAVGATVAYLTSTQTVTNTFTVGNVAIDLGEAEVNPDGTAVVPASRVKDNEYHLLPGHEYTKDPTMTVKADSEEAYVRMLVTINEQADLDDIFAPGAVLSTFFGGYDSTKWMYEGSTKTGDERTYEFRYHQTVAKSGTDTELEPLFTSIIVPDGLDNADLASIAGLKITVVGQAIQADGFVDGDAAWAAFS